MKFSAGFTLLELLVVIFLMGVLGRLGMVSLSSILETYQRNYVINQIQSDIAKLRGQALATGCPQTLEIEQQGERYSGRAIESCFSGNFGEEDLALFTQLLPPHVRVETTSPIQVNPRGFVVDAVGQPAEVTVTLLCRDVPCESRTLSILGVLQ